MVPPTNPNQAGSSAKQSLEAGLAALKQQDYPTAIALLESAAETAANQPPGIRAQMGLVAAYKATGNVKKAIALCSSLAKSPNSQVKAWGDRTLKQLIDSRPPKPPANKGKFGEILTAAPNSETPPETGFVAFDRATETPKIPPAGDVTGFVAFEPNVAPDRAKPKIVPPPTVKTSQLEKPAETSPEDASAAADTDIGGENSAGSPTDIPPFLSGDSYELTWRQAGRAQGWRPLKRLKLAGFRLEAIACTIALFFAARFVLQFLMTTANSFLVQIYIYLRLPFFQPIQLFYRDPTQFLQGVFVLLLAASPWLTDWLLKLYCGIAPLRATVLSKHSKEAGRVMRSFCKKQGMREPVLKLLPVDVPVALSYGCLPRFARIAVSQGLLEQLTEDEIAAVFARELGHIAHWDFAPMSLALLVLQIPYLIYWQAAHWGERLPDLMTVEFMRKAVKVVAGAVSAVSYGIYKLLKWPVLWLSRRRVFFSDRAAAEITGNPNGLTRAIGKIATGTASCVEQQQQTSFFLESFDLLLPVGVGQAVTLGSAALHSPLERILLWDVANPHRNWLTVNGTHPLLGERLKLLALYAQFWKLETELDLANLGTTEPPRKGKFPFFDPKFWAGGHRDTVPAKLLLQGAPFFGIPMSLAIVGTLWLLGGIFYYMTYIWQLDWLWGDRSLLWGCLPIGFSLGTLIRINYFFPDITPRTTVQPSLPDILSDPDSLPLDAKPVKLEGKLLGRSGISNWLGQDLILQTATGLVRLHYVSMYGPIGSWWPSPVRPIDLAGQSVVATGWLRRGATVAIDLESLRSPGGKVSNSGHPIWSAILAFAAAFWGAYIIVKGGR
jgi:Zn-dependent protease with chaperone function